MEELLARLAAGEAVRVPRAPNQSVRGLRVAIGRRASQRGMRVESVEGEGFLGVRRLPDPAGRSPRQNASGNGRRRRAAPPTGDRAG